MNNYKKPTTTFLLIAAVIATLLSVSTAAWAQTPVIYGLEYHIKNSYGGGSYLDTCGVASCSTTGRYSVVTDSLPDRVGAGTGMWRLESASGKAKGSNVLIGDVVHIRNLYAEGSYLDTCGGASCSTTTQWGVYTDSQPDRAGVGTGKWTVVSAAGKANGSQLLSSDVVHLRNMYSTGSYLDACGGTTCATTTKYGVMTDSQPNRDAGTGLWSFIPFGVAAAPPWNPVGNPAQSSTAVGGVASRAWDNNTDGNWGGGSVTHTADGDPHPWWHVDLGKIESIISIYIGNRTDCCSERLSGAKLFVSDVPFKTADPVATEQDPAVWTVTLGNATGWPGDDSIVGRTGRYVRVQLPFPGLLSLAEIAVKTVENPCRGRPTVHVGSGYNGCEWKPTDLLPDGTLVSISHNALERGVQRYNVGTLGINWRSNLERRTAHQWYTAGPHPNHFFGLRSSPVHSQAAVFRVTGHAENPHYVGLGITVPYPGTNTGKYVLQAHRGDFHYRSECFQSDLSSTDPHVKQLKTVGVVGFGATNAATNTFFRAMPNGRMDVLQLSPWVHAPLMPIENNPDFCTRGEAGGHCGTGTGSRGDCSRFSHQWADQVSPGQLWFHRYSDWDDGQSNRSSGWPDGVHQFFLLTPQ